MQQGLFGATWTPSGEIQVNAEGAQGSAMYQEINDPVDVIALFEAGKLKPQRFRWKGHVHRVAQVTGAWLTDRGAFKVRHFALMDEEANFFQLAYDERTTAWKVTRIWVE
jgi:hypothetical protein